MPLAYFVGVMTPKDVAFGAVGDGVTDDTIALQAFFDALEASPPGTLGDWSGIWGVSGPVTIKGSHRTQRPGTLKVLSNIDGDVAILDAKGARFGPDQLRIEAYQAAEGTHYTARLATNGLRIVNGENVVFEGGIQVDGLRRDGIVFDDAAVAHRCDLGEVFPINCGSAANPANDPPALHEIQIPFTAREDLGAQGVTTQSCKLTCAPHADVHVGDMVIYEDTNNEPYIVVDVGVDYVSVYPWLPAGVTTGNLRSCHGAGVRHSGSNSSNVTMRANPFRCGTGIACLALYGMVAEVVGHALGVGVQLARKGDSSHGNHFTRTYFEGGDVIWQIVQVGLGEDGNRFGGAAAVDPTKLYAIAPRLATGGLHFERDRFLFSVDLGHARLDRGPSHVGSGGILVSNAPGKSCKVIRRNNPTISIEWYPEYIQWDRLYIELDIRGATGDGPGNVTLQPAANDPGGTVQGLTSLTIDTSGPVRLTLTRDTSTDNWDVAEWHGVKSTPAP